MMKSVGRALMRLHRDEQGADMVEYILIIAAIALPLLAVVIIFWDNIKEWMYGTTQQVFDDTEAASDTGNMPTP